MKKCSTLKKIWKRTCFLLKDTRGELRFTVNGCEINATFSKEHNYDLLPRLKEILVDNPHIRHERPADSKIKENIKEAV